MKQFHAAWHTEALHVAIPAICACEPACRGPCVAMHEHQTCWRASGRGGVFWHGYRTCNMACGRPCVATHATRSMQDDTQAIGWLILIGRQLLYIPSYPGSFLLIQTHYVFLLKHLVHLHLKYRYVLIAILLIIFSYILYEWVQWSVLCKNKIDMFS